MILQALYEYYQRKDQNLMPPLGWEQRGFKYHVLIKADGTFIRFESLVKKDANGKDIPKQFYVPSLGEKKGNGIKANLLWENPEYMFGIPIPSKAKPEPDVERVAMQHQAFCERIRSFAQKCSSPAIATIVQFCDMDQSKRIQQDPLWPNIIRESPFLLITVEGQGFLFDIPEVRRAGTILQDEISDGFCLVTNRSSRIARLEPPIKGVWGTDAKAERSLVSFNRDSFNSFGKDQNFNSPISSGVTLAYSSALNVLLSNDSANRLQIGDASTIFWSEKTTRFERNYRSFFAMPSKENPDRGIGELRAAIESVRSGIPPEESSSRFYVLGLAPNSARIAVRFWHAGTVGEFAANIKKHFDDIAIITPSYDNGNQALSYLLGATALGWKSENVPPNMAGNVMRAVMSGGPYPATLLQQCLRRIRAEQGDVNRVRASILKACLNRRLRISNQDQEKEITVALDLDNTNVGYRLGRLFAVLEKIQEDSSDTKLNTTIRDRYYGAASSSPVTVFPQIMNKLTPHHMSKLKTEKPGLANIDERWLEEIISGLPVDMKTHLVMDDQARFAIGYYHQRQALFTSNKDNK